jgi:predicted acylesterase/phospholipase RssA/CRP-like cAMP-binding protein
MNTVYHFTASFFNTAEAAISQLFAPLELLLSPVLPISLTDSQINFAPRFLLLSILSLLFISCGRATLWYVKTKGRLDRAKEHSPDDILADRELRALRRALLMIDVTRHVPRLIKNFNHFRARKKIERTGIEDRGDGMVSLHAGTSMLEQSVVGGISPVIGFNSNDAVLTAEEAATVTVGADGSKVSRPMTMTTLKSLRYPSQVDRAHNAANNEGAASLQGAHADVLRILRTHTLFKYVDPALLSILAASTREITLNQDEVLFRCGTTVLTPSLYIVKSGSIRTYVEDIGGNDVGSTSANKKYLRTLHAGDTLSALLDLLNALTGLPITSQVTALAGGDGDWKKKGKGKEKRFTNVVHDARDRARERTTEESKGDTSQNTVVFKWDQKLLLRLGQEHPHEIGRLVRMILVKLNRATYSTMYQYLGLTTELTVGTSGSAEQLKKRLLKEGVGSGNFLKSRSAFTAGCQSTIAAVFGVNAETLPDVSIPTIMKFDDDPAMERPLVSQLLRARSTTNKKYTTERRVRDAESTMTRSPSSPADLYQASINAGRTSSSLSSSSSSSNIFSMSQRFASLSPEKKSDHHKETDDEEEDPMLLHVLQVDRDEILAEPGDSPCLFFVVQGELEVVMKSSRKGTGRRGGGSNSSSPTSSHRYRKSPGGRRGSKPATQRSSNTRRSFKTSGISNEEVRRLFNVSTGALVGLLPLQTGEPWLMTVRSSAAQTTVIRVTRECYAGLVQSQPQCLLRATKLLCSTFSPLLRMIDYGLTWRRMEPGEMLVQEGDACDRLCVVLHGRLREMSTGRDGKGDNGSVITVDCSTPPCAVAGGRHMIVGAEEVQEQNSSLEPSSFLPRGRGRPDDIADSEEYGRGSCVGESEVLAGASFSSTIVSIRETEVVEMSRELFHIVAAACPQVHQHVTSNLTSKLLAKNGRVGGRSAASASGFRQHGSRDNIATIAVLPITDHAPVGYLVSALSESLSQSTSVATVSSSRVRVDLGLEESTLFGDGCYDATTSAASSMDKGERESHDMFTVMSYLSQLEEMHRIVVYECDSVSAGPSTWTETCLRQADIVLLVGHNADPHDVTEYEKWATSHMSYAQNVLVLIHDMDWVQSTLESERKRCTPVKSRTIEEGHLLYGGYRPRNTRAWIHARTKDRGSVGIQHHLHVRVYKEDANVEAGGENFDALSPFSDVARLGRWLMGTQTGLTLGGGGARGLAHVGVYEAMVESCVPVDVIGGTSQGAFVGALIAMIHNPKQPDETRKELVRLSRKFAEEMSSNWGKIKDLTLPFTSYFNGSVFNAGIMRHFGDLRIEDLWLDYFCISTDITASKGIVHHNGTLWRYVRASMTLGPYLPPMCEVYPGDTDVHYLVDGGYVNNLPADHMRRLQSPLCVIAVDVSSFSDFSDYMDYGDNLSGCWQLSRILLSLTYKLICLFSCGICCRKRNNKNHKNKSYIPSTTDISTQLAYVSNTRQIPDRLRDDIDLYLKPGVSKYGTLEFGKFGEIREIGYKHARKSLMAWFNHLEREDNTLLLREVFCGDDVFEDLK